MSFRSKTAGFLRMSLFAAVSFVAVSTSRAVDLSEGFDNVAGLTSKGWYFQNMSSPLGVTDWYQGEIGIFTAQAGPANSYLAANFNNTGSTGTISNWAFTPTNTYNNGDTFSFYTRQGTNSPQFADRLQVRLSTNGSSVNVGNTALTVGDYATLLLDINPTLISNGYPQDWTQYVITLSGLGGPTIGRIAFRYFVTDGGSSGANSNYIGIDTLQITAVPEPSTYALATLGAITIGLAGRRRRRR